MKDFKSDTVYLPAKVRATCRNGCVMSSKSIIRMMRLFKEIFQELKICVVDGCEVFPDVKVGDA